MPESVEASQPFSPAFIAELLQSPSGQQQRAWLRGRGLLSERTAKQLFQQALDSIGSDPQMAGALADVCATIAEAEGWIDTSAQATYLRAQVHAIHAEFETALHLIEAAKRKFLAAGNIPAALRTDVGWMGVMSDLGRCRESIATGMAALRQIDAELGEQSLLAARMRNNLGICHEQLGQFDEAMDYWAKAEAAFLSNDAVEEACHAQNNRGLIYLKRGQAQSALTAFEAAARVFAEDDLVLNLAQAKINMSNAHFMLGDPGRGLACLEEARALIEPLGAAADNLVLLLDTAEAYQTLNLQGEALDIFQRVVPEMQTAGMFDERMRALLGMSSALITQGQSRQAVAQLNEFSAGHDAQSTPIRCQLQLNLALALSKTGTEGDAKQQAVHAMHEATTHGWQRQLAEAHLLFGELPSTSPATVIAHLEQAQAIASQVEWPALRTHVHQRLGRAYLQNGRGGEAERLLLTAVTDVEQSRATLDEDRFRIAFLTDKADAFDDLVQLYLQRSLHTSEATHRRSALKAAFAIAERAKSRALLDMMTNLAVPGAAPELPQSDESFGRVTFHLDEVRAQLDAKTILLYYYICGDEISAFVISKHTATNETIECVHALSKLSVVRPLLEALSVQWERFLAGPEFVARYAQQMEATGQRILFRLYQELVKPVEAHIHARTTQAGETPLVIMAHGPLHQVPFHALHDGTDYLVERYDISYAPSATTFLLSQQRKALGMDKSLVVGTDDASIPMALVEAQQVAQQLARSNAKPNSQVVLRVGAQATLQQVQADMAGCDIIHLACHGLFRHDNPLFSSVQLHDGKLTAADAARLRFNGALITLGACESGRSQVIAGDEMLGLPRAFLGAGASSVLVSLWLVNDAITAEFMTGWYEQIQQGVPRAQALRAMQRSIKRHHAHPYYWAPFILIGQR